MQADFLAFVSLVDSYYQWWMLHENTEASQRLKIALEPSPPQEEMIVETELGPEPSEQTTPGLSSLQLPSFLSQYSEAKGRLNTSPQTC